MKDKNGDELARCEQCHRTMIALKGEYIAPEYWVCSECMGETRIFTLAEHERSERE